MYIDMIKRKDEVLPHWTKNDGYDHVFLGGSALHAAESFQFSCCLGKIPFELPVLLSQPRFIFSDQGMNFFPAARLRRPTECLSLGEPFTTLRLSQRWGRTQEWRDYIPHSVFVVTEALTPRCGPSCFNAWKDLCMPLGALCSGLTRFAERERRRPGGPKVPACGRVRTSWSLGTRQLGGIGLRARCRHSYLSSRTTFAIEGWRSSTCLPSSELCCSTSTAGSSATRGIRFPSREVCYVHSGRSFKRSPSRPERSLQEELRAGQHYQGPCWAGLRFAGNVLQDFLRAHFVAGV